MAKNDFLLREIEKAEKALKRQGKKITNAGILAEQSFGFWVNLFESSNYKILLGRPIQIFSTPLPRDCGRKEVYRMLNDIRILRNRISHNEPICFTHSSVDTTYAKKCYESIDKILTWLHPSIHIMMKDLDNVVDAIKAIEKIV